MADATLIAQAAEQVRGVLDGAAQPDALEARQMQALSLAVHIPLVCFGIAFPAMILFVEGLYLRTGEAVYKTLAKRWSKVALIIFATGVVTGTILSFEFGLLWPDFMATFGEVFGVAFGLEGISELTSALLKLLSRHMRLLSDYFADAALSEVSSRLAQRLVDVAESFGVASDEGIAFATRLSQSELASMVGTARQTVNRVLQDFQSRGWLSIRGGEITLTNLPDLRATAQKRVRMRDFT